MSETHTRKKSEAKALIIVESPTKAKTITRFLGNDYVVLSSYGHVRDLPKSKLGIDVEKNFAPHYIVPLKAKPNVKTLKAELKKANKVILATDEDREGEAIAWHLTEALGLGETNKPTERIVFHEITPKAIEEALAHPRAIDTRLVNAQQARRVLDRLVGYELSPFLWRKLMRGLSAGRVQSVAVRLICAREEEIKAFVPQEYWTVSGTFTTPRGEQLVAILAKRNEEKLDKFAIAHKTASDEIVNDLARTNARVGAITKKELRKTPPTPFTTSTLQQDAWRKLRFSAKMTMVVAQQLYEGVELGATGGTGLITYMRTDSMHIAESALAEARAAIVARFGENYALNAPRRFKTKSKGAQEAHEAVRPTDPARHPDDIKEHLTPQQWKLYNLVWRRFIATQMEHAVFDATGIDILADGVSNTRYGFRANGIVKKFDGFLAAYPTKFEDTVLPVVTEGESLAATEIAGAQHFTEPPPRYTEASLVKALEENGIGRPSTYAPIISTVQARNYVEKNDQRRLQPTETGVKVDALLVQHFPQIIDIAFTAKMEEELDKVAEGEAAWESVIKEFYGPFHENLEAKYKEVQKENMDEATNEVCEKCGKPMVIKTGRFGRFLACTGFPECKTTKTIRKTTGITCPQCNEGELVEKKTKKRRTFWGCSRYPACEYASWTSPVKKKEEAEEMQAKGEQPPEENEEEN